MADKTTVTSKRDSYQIFPLQIFPCCLKRVVLSPGRHKKRVSSQRDVTPRAAVFQF